MNDTAAPLFAIVADDETIPRKMMSHALRQQGFICHTATDGEEAMQLIDAMEYQLVVTDLAMPHKNGHALAVELLKLDNRPLIVVHTAVTEPKITKDLMLRGVDDIVYKPTDYAAFAAKTKGLLERKMAFDSPHAVRPSALPRAGRAAPLPAPQAATATASAVASPPLVRPLEPAVAASGAELTSPATLDSTALKRSWDSLGIESMPFSQTALEVCRLACDEDSEAEDIAAAIEREPALTAELLRLGNSSHYNRSGKTVLDLEEIIVRLGRRHIGELALALNACATMRDHKTADFDVDLAWQRSLAARVALQLLITKANLPGKGSGAMLSAVMHLVGRMVLIRKFPDELRTLTQQATASGAAIGTLEKKTFQAHQSELLADLLSRWQIPDDIIGPLRHLESSYEQLVTLDPLPRRQAELVKLSVLIGWLAVGRWEAWDLVELPPSGLLAKYTPEPLSQVIQSTRQGLEQLLGEAGGVKLRSTAVAEGEQAYVCVVDDEPDFVAPLLESMGVPLRRVRRPMAAGDIVSCVNAKHARVLNAFTDPQATGLTILAEHSQREWLPSACDTLALPCAYGQLANALQP